MTFPGVWLIRVGYVVWALTAALTFLYLFEPQLDGLCELTPGSSVFGEVSRSWLPPGETCTWTDVPSVGHSLVASPPLSRLAIVGMALAGLPVLSYLRRLLADVS